jgi:hypothetical protein
MFTCTVGETSQIKSVGLEGAKKLMTKIMA